MLEPWAVRGQGLAKRLKKDVYWWLRERRIFDRARCIFFTTQREKNLAGTVYAIDRLMLIVTPYGVDFRLSDGEGDAAVRIRAISEGPYALFLGRVHRKKNPGLLLEAWARADVPPPWKLVIAGPCEDELQAELDGMVRRLGLTGRVEFPGFVGGADKACLLRSARWFVLPSSQENFGIAVLEAVQAGCPVAMSDQVFLSDEFHQEAEVMPVRVEVWAAFFAERMRDERHRETVMAMDRVTVAKRFDIEEVTRGWVETMEMAFRSQV
jgi:glycosyltransferase involved in cell wall biosynthesis